MLLLVVFSGCFDRGRAAAHPTPASGDTAPAPLPGCGSAAPTSGVRTLDHRGVQRTYGLQVPASYDPEVPTPLIVAFHGWGGTERDYLGSAAVAQGIEERGYLLVAPRGLGSGPPDRSPASWSFRGSTTGLDGDGVNRDVPNDSDAICDDAATPDHAYPSCAGVAANGCAWTQCQDDDVDFVLALLDALAEDLCVDPDRVFATGGSNGGMFTWELAQDPRSAGRLRAIAPLIGLPHRGFLDGPGRPDALPTLLVTGTRDPTVPPGAWEDPSFTTTSDGDLYHYTGATAIARVFAAHHGCPTDGPAVPFDVGDPATDCRTYCAGDAGWPRVLDCRRAMGHTYGFGWAWPLVLDFFDAQAEAASDVSGSAGPGRRPGSRPRSTRSSGPR